VVAAWDLGYRGHCVCVLAVEMRVSEVVCRSE